mgnify:CR=1 FL=1
MNKNIETLIPNFIKLINSFKTQRFRLIFVLLPGLLLLAVPETRSDEIFLKCTGKFEINRGALIKPDWETIYLKINLNGLMSTINDQGIETKGRTSIRRNSYTITNRDIRNRINKIYKVNGKHGIYIVETPQENRTLIGTCQKGRG